MKAVVMARPAYGAFEWRDVPVPEPGPRDVLVKVQVAAICGSDIHVYRWSEWAQGANIPVPYIAGHEFCGEVVAVGSQVTAVKPGDRVAGETHIPCGQCYQCRTGLQHICHNERIFGIHTNGCFAEYTLLPEPCAVKVMDGVRADEAALLEPMGGPFRAAVLLDPLGSSLFLQGCGPIGLFGIAIARLAGAATIISSDVSDYRLELAKKMGADVLLNPKRDDVAAAVRELTGGLGVDGVADFSGNVPAIEQIFGLARHGGKAVLFGVPDGPVKIDAAGKVILSEVNVQGLHGRKMYETWYKTQRLLAVGRLDVSPVITHRMPMADAVKAMELAVSGQAGKILLYP